MHGMAAAFGIALAEGAEGELFDADLRAIAVSLLQGLSHIH